MPNVYIDASGIAGVAGQRNEHPRYVLCAVYMANERQDEILRDVHRRFVAQLSGDSKEFKSNSPNDHSEAFLRVLLDECDWCYAAAIALKDQLYNSKLSKSQSCERWFIKKTLLLQRSALKTGIVYIDQGSNTKSDQELLADLRADKELGAYQAVKDARSVDSCSEPGVQLADAIAGRIYRRTHLPNREVMDAYKLVRKRETVVWSYPEDASDARDEGVQPISKVTQAKFSKQLKVF